MRIAPNALLSITLLLAALPWSSAVSDGDAAAGKAKIATCVACHGTDGNSTINPLYPKIGGQIPGYVASTLAAYKSGQREDPTMGAMVASLSEQDMADIDAYYAQFDFGAASIEEDDLPAAQSGRELYRIGQTQYAIPACMACHGPAGRGIPARFPRVSGQQRDYLVKSLIDYKIGRRVSEEMNPIAFRLSEAQINDLAIYMHGLN